MIKAILIDDETDSVKVLQRLLELYCPEVEVIGNADGVETGVAIIEKKCPDLVFLDIEMIRGNGFDLLNRLSPFCFQVVFITAFDNYAIRAFKYSALDYLLKPVDIDELRRAVNRARERMDNIMSSEQVSALLQNLKNQYFSTQKLTVSTSEGKVFIPIL